MADKLTLTLTADGERLDKALCQAMPQLSRMRWQQLIKEGHVTLAGETLKPSQRIRSGDTVAVVLPEPVETDIIPENIPLDVRYEDDDIIILNKPAGMVVHPGTGHYSGTLVNALLYYCPDLAGVGGEKRPGIVHRLDKHTSGLIAVAKHEQALYYLQGQFQARTVGKKYLALVEGQLQPPAALIDAPIGRDPNHRKKMAVITSTRRHSRSAQTYYETLTAYDDYTFIRCDLHTGRTHQIRVHMAYLNHPIVCDHIYGRRKCKFRWLRRHFLHAAELTLKRPSDRQEITVTSDLTPDLQEIIHQLDHA